MGKIYVGQTDLTIKLETKKNLTGITNVKILYKNPNGLEGEFTATVVDAAKGIIQYAVTSVNDIGIVGRWFFWAKIVNLQGLISIGEPSTVVVYEEGKSN